MSSPQENKNIPVIKLICFNLNPKTLPSTFIYSIYFTTTLCSQIKLTRSELLEYDKTLNNVPLHISFTTIDLSSSSTQKQELIIKQTNKANYIVIFLHLEKNVDSINELKKTIDFIKNDCEIKQTIPIYGFYKFKECIDDELEESKVIEALNEIEECLYEYKEIDLGNKNDLMTLIDGITDKAYVNYSGRKDEEGETEEQETKGEKEVIKVVKDNMEEQDTKKNDENEIEENDNEEIAKDEDVSGSKCEIM